MEPTTLGATSGVSSKWLTSVIYQIPSSALTSSDAMVCGSHGGLEGDLTTFAFFTPSTASIVILHGLHEHRTDGTHRRGQGHHHVDALAVFAFGGDIVNETEVKNYEIEFGVFDFDERFANLFDSWHSLPSVAPRLEWQTFWYNNPELVEGRGRQQPRRSSGRPERTCSGLGRV